MKRVVKASMANDRAYRNARTILKKAQELLDAMENTPSGFLDANDLGDLYECLINDIPALSFAIESGIIES